MSDSHGAVVVILATLVIKTFQMRFAGEEETRPPPIQFSSVQFITGPEGDRCQDNQTCLLYYKHSHCELSNDVNYPDGICTCNPGYARSIDGKQCLPADRKMGESCEDDSQCSTDGQLAAVCVQGSGICDCVPGFFPSDDLKNCYRVVNVLGLEPCMDDLQCQLGQPGKLSHCVEKRADYRGSKKVCKCKPGAVSGAGEDKCYPVAKSVGDSCKIHAQCMAGLKYSRCVDSQCDCNRGYELRQTDYFSECYPVSVKD